MYIHTQLVEKYPDFMEPDGSSLFYKSFNQLNLVHYITFCISEIETNIIFISTYTFSVLPSPEIWGRNYYINLHAAIYLAI
jgi:hypothetical protein